MLDVFVILNTAGRGVREFFGLDESLAQDDRPNATRSLDPFRFDRRKAKGVSRRDSDVNLSPVLQPDPQPKGGKMPVQVGHGIEEWQVHISSGKQRNILTEFELESGR